MCWGEIVSVVAYIIFVVLHTYHAWVTPELHSLYFLNVWSSHGKHVTKISIQNTQFETGKLNMVKIYKKNPWAVQNNFGSEFQQLQKQTERHFLKERVWPKTKM